MYVDRNIHISPRSPGDLLEGKNMGGLRTFIPIDGAVHHGETDGRLHEGKKISKALCRAPKGSVPFILL